MKLINWFKRYLALRKRFGQYLKERRPCLGEELPEFFEIDGVEYAIRHKRGGDCFDSFSYMTELIREDTNKVIFRKGSYTDELDHWNCHWHEVDQVFYRNV